jgi:ribonuclease HIII
VQKTVDFFSGLGFSASGNNTVTNLKREKSSISLYSTGTVICELSGDIYSGLVRDYFTSLPFDYREYARNGLGLSLPACWAGSDEAGKGDYFGPLVVAAVSVNDDIARKLFISGITDSKRLSRSELVRLSESTFSIAGSGNIEIMCISPASFNRLYDKMQNMNDILAWAHQKALLTVSARSRCTAAVIDKFSTDRTVDWMRKGLPEIELHAMTGGEREIAVAAASVMASARFVKEMEAIGESIGVDIQFGAGDAARKLARAIVREKGVYYFREIGKANFRL